MAANNTHTGHTLTVQRDQYYTLCKGCKNPLHHQSIQQGAKMMMVIEQPCNSVQGAPCI